MSHTDPASQIVRQLCRLERCLNTTCDQLQLLSDKICGVQVRLDRSRVHRQRGAGQSLELQLVTLQGMYNMYYQYGEVKGHEIMALHKKLLAASKCSREAQQQTDSCTEGVAASDVTPMDYSGAG